MAKLLGHIHTGPENPTKARGYSDSLFDGLNARFAIPTAQVTATTSVDWAPCD